MLGIGAGWKEDEWIAYGYGFPDARTRLAMFRDHLEIITRMLGPGRASYQGTHSHVVDAVHEPKGVQARVPILVGGQDVLQHVQRVGRLVPLRHWPGQHVMDLALEAPLLLHAAVDILDEDGVEIDGRDLRHFLADDPRAEGVAAADLQGGTFAAQHLGHELVARQEEGHAARVVVPALVGHQAQGCQPPAVADVEAELVLRFAGRGLHVSPSG